jgi:hypothetical protein
MHPNCGDPSGSRSKKRMSLRRWRLSLCRNRRRNKLKINSLLLRNRQSKASRRRIIWMIAEPAARARNPKTNPNRSNRKTNSNSRQKQQPKNNGSAVKPSSRSNSSS